MFDKEFVKRFQKGVPEGHSAQVSDYPFLEYAVLFKDEQPVGAPLFQLMHSPENMSRGSTGSVYTLHTRARLVSFLENHFKNPLAPTEEELLEFEMQEGLTYPLNSCGTINKAYFEE